MEGGRMVGEYLIVKQIGSGAFSVVWLARHREGVREVAVKEMALERLNKKLRESLLSEVSILKRISHPNIISLFEFIQDLNGKIYLILEYCRGGDLSAYLHRHRHGRIPEATAKNFMRQLASGLQQLRNHNVVHRDLKPQNILLSANDENAVLKIADFGFAKHLNPYSLAQTFCGSPLYMAPEVLEVKKYDAKADLWSLGVILYQLVTGRTPYNGANQIQLLENIRNNELRFPPDVTLSTECIDLCKKLLSYNPVERLTVEEFLNHQFLIEHASDGSLSGTSPDAPAVSSPSRPSGQSSHDNTMHFPFDAGPAYQDGGLFANPGPSNRFPVRKFGKSPDNSPSKHTGFSTRYGFENNNNYNKINSNSNTMEGMLIQQRRDYTGSSRNDAPSKFSPMAQVSPSGPSPDDAENAGVTDSMEFLKEYVVVPGPHVESLFSSATNVCFHTSNSPSKYEESPPKMNLGTAPMPIPPLRNRPVRTMESPVSPGSVSSVEMGEGIDRPSSDNMSRIRSLQQCASAISDLLKQEKQLRALSLQLVVLAIWKQAMQICHRASAASAVIEGSPSRDRNRRMRSKPGSYNNSSSPSLADSELADAIRASIEKDFLVEVARAEELASYMGHISEATEMPDAIEIIFQSALTSGRDGGVDEMMGNTERAVSRYCRAVSLLRFLLVEAPVLDLNPPFSLTQTDRYRLRSYIEVLNGRLSQLSSQRPAAV